MAHELAQLTDGTYSMLRSEDTDISWHGLETVIPADAPFDTWLNHQVFDWKINRSKVRYAVSRDPDVPLVEMPSQHVLFRSDNHKPLSTVSEDYHVVQPRQVLEFFQDLCAQNHLKLDTAGYIRNGVKFWALARTGNEVNIGANRDVVKQYVLLASSCDSSMATTAKHTSLRVVCSNTFHASINNGEAAVKVRHSREFNETEVKMNLGLMDAEFVQLGEYANEMSRVMLQPTDAVRWFAELISNKVGLTDEEVFDIANKSRVHKSLWDSYVRAPGAQPTLWGCFNGVTYTVDHVRGRSFDTRFDSAQFGAGASLKKTAWDKAAALIEGIRAANDAMLVTAA